MTGPRRIVCLTEETTETLYLLGEQDRIVGISAFTVRPPEAKKTKPVVSQYVRAEIDKIVELKPDLVLAFSDLQADICADLVRRGLEVHCFNQRSVAEILEMIRTLGVWVDASSRADRLIDQFRTSLDASRETARNLPAKPRVYFEEWPEPIITGIQWVSELIEIAGGVDCFEALRSCRMAKDRIVTAQDVVRSQPDLYLASWCGRAFRADVARSRAGFAEAPFTRQGRMVSIESSIILQPGPACLTAGLEAISSEIVRVAYEIGACE